MPEGTPADERRGGAFVFGELPAGEHAIAVEPQGYARTRFALPALAPGEDREGVVIELVPGGALEGVVLLPGGRPAEGSRRKTERTAGARAR